MGVERGIWRCFGDLSIVTVIVNAIVISGGNVLTLDSLLSGGSHDTVVLASTEQWFPSHNISMNTRPERVGNGGVNICGVNGGVRGGVNGSGVDGGVSGGVSGGVRGGVNVGIKGYRGDGGCGGGGYAVVMM